MREHKAAEHQEQLILPPRPEAEVPGSTRDLSLDQIREWVDVYRAANDGRFPSQRSGEILNTDGSKTGETWVRLHALFRGAQKGAPARGLRSSGFESLADFLDKTYPDERKFRGEKQDLSIDQIKVWVDVYREANDGKFPSTLSGEILNADGSPTGENWGGLNSLFRDAQEGARARGLKGSGFESLADFLDKTYPGERKFRGEKQDLSIDQIKGWVDVHRAANDGNFPSGDGGHVLNADGSPTGETWAGLDALFHSAQKGFPSRGLRGIGFESLPDFLDKTYLEEREVRIEKADLSIDQIKVWVDVYRAANNRKFPSTGSGEVLNADGSPTGENWSGLHSLFQTAQRGAPARGLGGLGLKSLRDFLDKTYPGERKFRGEKLDLSIDQIKVWVDVYREANDGKFPSTLSGEILNADGSPTGENWSGLDSLFRDAQEGARARGLKGLGFESLADLLDKTYPDERKVRIEKPDLSIDQIRGWVGVYRAGHDGKFPSMHNGEVLNADGSPSGETWAGLNSLFNHAQRGYPSRGLQGLGFKSLADFLDKTYPDERKFRGEKLDLSIEQIQAWVDVYRAANDRKFPSILSGEVLNTDGSQTGESWKGLNSLFKGAQKAQAARGLRGFGFESLADFLDKTYPDERKVRVRIEKPDLSIDQIKVWVEVYRAANDRKFPSASSGEVLNTDGSQTGETWRGLESLFNTAQQGLHSRGLGGFGFKSLRDFLDKTYPGERKFRGEKLDLSIDQIKVWVDVYREANDGKFPSTLSGEILNADGSPTGENWSGLNSLFKMAEKGRPSRGLQHSGFTSLRDFLDKTYPTERARERRAPTARPEVDDINVLLDLLE